MGDLLQSQIQESCRLALPEGLKDLMSDISREVLRTQPQNLYQFIADYLSALLVAREHLFIASRVCDDICKNRCCQKLEDELRGLSLSEEDVQESLKIITEYFSTGAVKEGNLLQKLVQKTDIEQKELPLVQEAVRRAFLRHQVNHTVPIESSSTDSDVDEITLAAKHTLKIYKEVTEQPDVNYHCVASKIQAAYRAYNVRRKRANARNEVHSGKRTDTIEKVRFHFKDDPTPTPEKLVADLVQAKRCASKCSSESLAGSFVSLPPYKPYRIEQRSVIAEQDEVCEKEKEHATFDYVTNANSRSPRECQEFHEPENIKEKKTTISFHNLPKVVEVDYNEALYETDETDYDDFEEVDEGAFDELQISDQNGAHSDDIDEELVIGEDAATVETPVVSDLKEGKAESNKILVDENDYHHQVQKTEMQRTAKEWISDDSSEATEDHDVDDDMYKVEDGINAELVKVTICSIEESPIYESDDDVVDVDESLEGSADDMDQMIENQVDEGDTNFFV